MINLNNIFTPIYKFNIYERLSNNKFLNDSFNNLFNYIAEKLQEPKSEQSILIKCYLILVLDIIFTFSLLKSKL